MERLVPVRFKSQLPHRPWDLPATATIAEVLEVAEGRGIGASREQSSLEVVMAATQESKAGRAVVAAAPRYE